VFPKVLLSGLTIAGVVYVIVSIVAVALVRIGTLPVIGCLASLYLVTQLSGRPARQNVLALILVAIGILLFFLTWVINRQLGIRGAGITDPTHLGSAPD
jgi:hypothetical protein